MGRRFADLTPQEKERVGLTVCLFGIKVIKNIHRFHIAATFSVFVPGLMPLQRSFGAYISGSASIRNAFVYAKVVDAAKGCKV